MKKKVIMLMIASTLMFSFTGCRESKRVSHNLSLEADNFNIVRKVTVISLITNDVLFQMSGRLSIETPNDNRLEIVVEDDGKYKKHFVLLGDNTTVTVEDLGIGANDVSKYKYTLNYNPKMWIPVNIKSID